jgi:hypothetical protein
MPGLEGKHILFVGGLEMKIDVLVGRMLSEVSGMESGSEKIIIVTTDGERFAMEHIQDCCETVEVYDVCGDPLDLVGSLVIEAEEVSDADNPVEWNPECAPESHTWTFYKIGTQKGFVTIRWLGKSNGYYSERVNFFKED